MKKGFTLAKSVTYVSNFADTRKAAFTLAEVLITLGVIGCVAALTIPNLMGKYRERVAMTKVKKFYTTMAQVQLRSIADNGEVDGWDWISDEEGKNNEKVMAWFNKYWAPYLNNVEVIDRKVLKDDKLEDGGIVFKMADGSVSRMSGFSGGYLHFDYYLNLKDVENRRQGINNFLFGFAKGNSPDTPKCRKRFNVYACDITDINYLKNNGWGGCYKEQTANGHPYCTRLLQLNDWKIPADYPYKF